MPQPESPWIIIHFDSITTTTVVPQAKERPEVLRFPTVFHIDIQRNITVADEAIEQGKNDPKGLILLNRSKLQMHEMISLPDRNVYILELDLIVAYFTYLKEINEKKYPNNAPLHTCILVVPFHSRQRRLYQFLKHVAFKVGFKEIRAYNETLCAAYAAKDEIFQYSKRYVLFCDINDDSTGIALLKKSHEGFVTYKEAQSYYTSGRSSCLEKLMESVMNIVNTTSPQHLLSWKNKRNAFIQFLRDRFKQNFTVNFDGIDIVVGKKKIKISQDMVKNCIRKTVKIIEDLVLRFLKKRKSFFCQKQLFNKALLPNYKRISIVINEHGYALSFKKLQSSILYSFLSVADETVLGAYYLLTYDPLLNASNISNSDMFITIYVGAINGNIRSRLALVKIYNEGKFCVPLQEEIYYWILQIAKDEKNRAKAMYQLYKCNFNGYGTSVDYLWAFYYLIKSSKEYAKAQYQLGLIYLNLFEQRKKRDCQEKSFRYLSLAEKNGYKQAREVLDSFFLQNNKDPVVKKTLSSSTKQKKRVISLKEKALGIILASLVLFFGGVVHVSNTSNNVAFLTGSLLLLSGMVTGLFGCWQGLKSILKKEVA